MAKCSWSERRGGGKGKKGNKLLVMHSTRERIKLSNQELASF